MLRKGRSKFRILATFFFILRFYATVETTTTGQWSVIESQEITLYDLKLN